MSFNVESPRSNFGDRSQLTNWILDLGETCHMAPDISDFIPVSMLERYKYIEATDGHLVTAKKTGEAQIKMYDDNGKPFIATLYTILFLQNFAIDYFTILW